MLDVRKLVIGAVVLTPFCLGLAQQTLQPLQERSPVGKDTVAAKNVSATESANEAPKPTEEQKLAFQTLEVSEATARGFQAPMRSYGLLQIGSTFTTLDATKSRGLLREAFTASLEIRDDDDTKVRLQQDIFRTLLPVSQQDVEELLTQAETRVRNLIAIQLMGTYAEKKQFDKGLELINQIAAVNEFPYGSASRLMDAMPPEMAAEKQSLFTQAVSSYKSHEHPDVLIGSNTLTGMIGRFGLTMPPKLVLQAIDEILSQAKSKADQGIRLAGPGGSASFANDYQYQLFALLPTLHKLDESRAKQLLDENQDLQAKMQQFPDGMNSLMPPPPPAGTKGASVTTGVRTITGNRRGTEGAGPAQGGMPPVGTVPDYLRRDARSRMEAIAREAETDPVQAIAHSMTLPLELDDRPQKSSPRAEALESIARANVKKNPGAAASALAELRKVITDLPLPKQAQYLSSAANLYLQMDDKDKADTVVGEGFKVADKLLELDTNPDSPNEALKAWWPSTDAYRRFVQVETRISDRATLAVLKEIKDPEIRATESIMFARSLLGLPPKQFTVVEKRGSITSSTTSDSN
jgi:hypothetical protein